MSEQKVEVCVCGRCKKPIIDAAYIQVNGAIVLQKLIDPAQVPLYRCKEHAENYAMRISMHADCWIATLRDHGAPLHDMAKILEGMRTAEAAVKAAAKKKK